MTWVREGALSWLQSLCVEAVGVGRVPRHVAFIMDGNRRYASRCGIERGEGHSRGFDKLAQTLRWCLDLGVPEVTVYAFSIENFKRADDELDALMSLAEDKFRRLLDEREALAERGIKVAVVGRLEMLSAELRSLIARACLMTEGNSRARLNVAFAYTARDEMARTAGELVSAVAGGELRAADVTEELFDATLELSPPDLLVRTSGEVRLSDFMLWQVSDAVLHFTDTLWPDFSIWHLLAAVVHFQRVAPPPPMRRAPPSDARCKAFLERFHAEKLEKLKSYVIHT